MTSDSAPNWNHIIEQVTPALEAWEVIPSGGITERYATEVVPTLLVGVGLAGKVGGLFPEDMALLVAVFSHLLRDTPEQEIIDKCVQKARMVGTMTDEILGEEQK